MNRLLLMVQTIHLKWRRSVARRGLQGTAADVVPALYRHFRALSPRGRRAAREDARRFREFDRANGIDTAREVELAGLEVLGRRELGHRYSPTSERTFLAATASVPDEGYTFVDYGSGKGLVLFMAARRPFRAVVGVEFAPELHRIAEANIARPDPARRCHDMQSVCGDAAEFEPPPGPLVCFFFNPFAEGVLRAVLNRLKRSLESEPRDIWAVYVFPDAHAPLDETDWLTLVEAKGGYRVYRTIGTSSLS